MARTEKRLLRAYMPAFPSAVILACPIFDYRVAIHQVGLLAVSEALRELERERGAEEWKAKR